MAIEKPTTTRDLSKDAGGPPATGPTATVPAGQPQVSPDGNLIPGDPPEPRGKTVKLTSPAGTKVTVEAGSELAKGLKSQGW